MSATEAVVDGRFWSKVRRVQTPGMCWEWQGSRNRNPNGTLSYGRKSHRGRSCLAHRLSWEHFYGPIPDGLCVLHRCDNQRCVNPEHLFLGTQKDNMSDASRKGRTQRGEAKYGSKLTSEQVRALREEYAAGGVSQEALARRYGIGHSAVSDIVRRKKWRHV